MDNWDLIAESATRNTYIDTVVNGIRTVFIRTTSGAFFTLAVSQDNLSEICSDRAANLLMKETNIAGRVIIGRLVLNNTGPPSDCLPTADDESLRQHIRQATAHFANLVEHFGRWASLNEFMKAEIDYDASEMPLEVQPPFEYWWLVGKTEADKPVHQTPLYRDAGVFIKPGDGNLPLFTSSLYADMASRHYSRDCGTRLIPVKVRCPVCYLNGLGGFIGSEVFKGALLDERWQIRLFTCQEQNYSAPGHFYISDFDGEEYALAGCPDRGIRPHWVIRRWGHDERWFPKKCNRLPWSNGKN
ncbi:MAG: hypothetical protein HYX80_00700 [Chloroflexi bacterium]|nr:hypothetical protein [Chloroflexota bacterium]